MQVGHDLTSAKHCFRDSSEHSIGWRSQAVAAEQRLHTSQPSLSRQIRDLESEVGAQLLTRRARGIELTPAGRAFLDHAHLVLSQVDAASEAARRVAHPSKPCFTMGFL